MLNAPVDSFCSCSKTSCSSFGRRGGAGAFLNGLELLLSREAMAKPRLRVGVGVRVKVDSIAPEGRRNAMIFDMVPAK